VPVINPALIAALLGTVSDASQRRQTARLNRKPSFGRTLSQSVAGSVGQIPGRAIGSFLEEQIAEPGRVRQREFQAGEREANQAFQRSEREAGQTFETRPVALPPEAADILGRPDVGADQLDALIRLVTSMSERKHGAEPVTVDGVTAPRDLIGPAATLENAKRNREAEMIELLPSDRAPGGLFEGVGVPIPGGPESLLEASGGLLSPETWADMQRHQAGARDKVTRQEFSERRQARGDAATAAQSKAETERKAEADRLRHQSRTDSIAQRDRAMAIRRQMNLDNLAPDQFRTQYQESERNLREAESRLMQARKSASDPFTSPEKQAAWAAEVERLEGQIEGMRDQRNAFRDSALDRAVNPPNQTQAPSPGPGTVQPPPTTTTAPRFNFSTNEEWDAAVEEADVEDLPALLAEYDKWLLEQGR